MWWPGLAMIGVVILPVNPAAVAAAVGAGLAATSLAVSITNALVDRWISHPSHPD
jgi:hypothetical protein